MASPIWGLRAKWGENGSKWPKKGPEFCLIRLILSHWVVQIPPNWFWRHILWIFRCMQKRFWKLPFFAKSRAFLWKSGLIFGPKSNIFTFPIFWSATLVLRLGALENLKMGQVIHKIGLSKLYAAIFEIFIFWPVWADFRGNYGKFCHFLPKIDPYGPKNENFKNRRI